MSEPGKMSPEEERTVMERWAAMPGFKKLIVGPFFWASIGERFGDKIRDKIATLKK